MQLTYNENPAIGRAGMLADAGIVKHVTSRLADGRIKAGLGVFRSTGYGDQSGSSDLDPGHVYQNPSAAFAADVDAIMGTKTVGTTVGGYDYTAADADGVIGAASMQPGRKLTLVLSNTTNWDAGTAVISYIDAALNSVVSENLTIPNNGNVTLTTTGYAKRFVSLHIPAQSGAATFTAGVTIVDASVTAADFDGIALLCTATLETQSDSDLGEYLDRDAVSVLKIGRGWVTTEGTTTEGAAVYVRTIANGTGKTQLGAFRADDDSSTAVLVPGAKFYRSATSGGINIVGLAY